MNQLLPSLKWLRLALLLLGVALAAPHHLRAASKAEPLAPIIDEQPVGRRISEGGHLTLSVQAHGTAALTYEWRKGESPLADDARVSGATTDVLNIDPVQLGDDGDYFVIITAGGLSTTSTVAAVTVNQLGLQLTVGPGSGLTMRTFGPVGDVYRVESANNVNGPWITNGFYTNYLGFGQTFRPFAGLGNLLRPRLDHMLPVLYASNSAPGLRAYGKLNQIWRFQGTTNFVNWDTLTVATNTRGWVKFTDPSLPLAPRRFYRITPP